MGTRDDEYDEHDEHDEHDEYDAEDRRGDPAGDQRGDGVLRIDCAECALEGTAACVDCVVTWLVDRDPGSAVVVDAAEVRALRALARGGLAPQLRHRPRQPA